MASLDVTATVRLHEIRCDECDSVLEFKADVDSDGDIVATVEKCSCEDE